MAYLDNLIAWGDALFRQDTGESHQRGDAALRAGREHPRPAPAGGAAQGLAAHRRPTRACAATSTRWATRSREIEADIPFDLAPPPTGVSDDAQLAALRSIGSALYFCVPRNDKLLAYWDTVADRLFKIRNSLNIQGVFRQLPLFDPPIDPAMLARAAAAGLDVGAIVSGLNQPLPLVRFRLLASQAVGDLPGGQVARRPAARPRSRRRTPRRSPCCAPGRSGSCWSWPRWCGTRRGRRRSRPRRRWRRRWPTRSCATRTTRGCSGNGGRRHRRCRSWTSWTPTRWSGCASRRRSRRSRPATVADRHRRRTRPRRRPGISSVPRRLTS